MPDYAGLDYGLGTSNIDTSNGIRYGVISQHTIMPEALDDMEMYYGEPHCPVCGNEVLSIPVRTEQSSNGVAVYSDVPAEMEDWPNYSTHGCADYSCAICEHTLDSSEVYSEESLGFSYDADGYKLSDCLDSDIFILKSLYYTHAQFCSPCVPGAGNLDNPCATGPKTYCLGHDWFENSKAPYAVYSVATGELVYPDSK